MHSPCSDDEPVTKFSSASSDWEVALPGAAGDAWVIGNTVHVGVQFTFGGGVDVAGVEVDETITIPVVQLALESAGDEGVG